MSGLLIIYFLPCLLHDNFNTNFIDDMRKWLFIILVIFALFLWIQKNESANTMRLLRFKFSQIRDGDKLQCVPPTGNEYLMHWLALRIGKYSCWHFWLPEGRYPHSLEAFLHPCHEQDKDRPQRWQSHS